MSNATQGGGGQSAYNSNKVTLTGQNSADGIDPLVEVTYTSALEGQGQSEVTIDIEVSGATTPNLTLNAESITTATVKCKISQPNAVLNRADANGDTIFSNGTLDGGLVTKDALFESISENNKSISIVNTEIVDDKDSSIITTNSQNLFLNDVVFQGATTDPAASGRSYIIYAPDEPIAVKVTMAGSAGQDVNGNLGGNGGVTVFTYTLKQNTEYVFKLSHTVNPPESFGGGGAAAYFYEKGRLLVACGGGGASGYNGGSGGNGGGAGIAGGDGSGNGGGAGGVSVAAGQLPEDGLSSFPPYLPGPFEEQFPNYDLGGKVESCTSGDHYAAQGISPCDDIGNSKFKTFDGTEVSGSAEINRGYKADGPPEIGEFFIVTNGGDGFRHNGGGAYHYIQAESSVQGGGGGSGAYGGDGASSSNGGGGGGSGYTNGSVNVISTSSDNETNICFAQIELL